MSEETLVEEQQFTCPTCGSHEWGEYKKPVEADGVVTRVTVGLCHKTTTQADGSVKTCGYEWDRPDGDSAVFAPTGNMIPSTGVVPIYTDR